MANSRDLYQEITDRIIEQLEQGFIPWNRPWCGVRAGAISYATGKPYSLVNQFMLKPGEYITFNECRKQGGKVKKGAHAHMVVFWKVIWKEKKDSTGNVVTDHKGKPVMESLPFLRYFNVFALDDCEGIEPRWKDKLPEAPAKPAEAAEQALKGYVARSGVRFENVKQNRAYYSPALDKISLPLMEQFTETAEYYSTAFHEATHSTGHKSRLNRFSIENAMFASEDYSKEELTAEIGAACIMNSIGLETTGSFKNSAAYIQNWLTALKNDKRMIVGAAARAERAVKMILDIKANEQEEAA